MSERVREFVDNLKLYSQENGHLENACPAQDYISEFNRTVIKTDEEIYVLWYFTLKFPFNLSREIIGYNFFSQFLSLLISIYYLTNNSLPITCRLYPNSYKSNYLQGNIIELILGTIIKTICFLLPIVITLKAFWIARSKSKHPEEKVSSDILKINDSFSYNQNDRKFWDQLKFQSKATEKTSSDEFINGINLNGSDFMNSVSEEEKSPISKISFLSQNLQKQMNIPKLNKE